MERSGTNVIFHCLKILECNKENCSFRQNCRGRMEYHSLPSHSAPFHLIPSSKQNPKTPQNLKSSVFDLLSGRFFEIKV